MWGKCLKSISLFTCTLFFLSCGNQLKSLSSDKIPVEVGQHFSVIQLDSAGSLKPASFRYETEKYVSIFTMDASLKEGKVKGKLREEKFSKELPNLPVDGDKQKPLGVSLKYKICCSNHKPNDCVNSKIEASDTASRKGCSGWRLIIL
jgi:hypothetical protein